VFAASYQHTCQAHTNWSINLATAVGKFVSLNLYKIGFKIKKKTVNYINVYVQSTVYRQILHNTDVLREEDMPHLYNL